MRSSLSAIVSVALLAVSAPVCTLRAQDDGEPILHEFFQIHPDDPLGSPAPLSRLVDDVVEGQLIYNADGIVPPAGREDNTGFRNAAPPEGNAQVLDRLTEREGWLTYFAAFDPTVAPFKRVRAFDRVTLERHEVGLTTARDSLVRVELSEIPVGEVVESFWGAILVELEPEVLVPIPSVAADMAIHRYTASPSLDLRFYRDDADNYYVLSEAHRGVVRLDYQVTAPTAYFGGTWPEQSHLEDIPADLRPSVPDEILPVTQEVFERLGLHEGLSIGSMIARLVEYFRAFRAEPFPISEQTEHLFRDILLGGRGVCRHRAFAFVVTAQAWGIPARYVYNEAHAFAEVYFPESGWRRIDLGGAAEGLLVRNAASRILHAPVGGDPLPAPDLYREGYTCRMEEQFERTTGDSTGMPAAEGTGGAVRVEGLVGTDSLSQVAFEGWDPFRRNSDGLGDFSSTPTGATGDPPHRADLLSSRIPTRLVLQAAPEEGYRGESLRVVGRLQDQDGRGLPGREVAVYLGPPAERESERIIGLGGLVTDERGVLSGTLTIPPSLPLGVWGIYLVFLGDEQYAPSRSQ